MLPKELVVTISTNIWMLFSLVKSSLRKIEYLERKKICPIYAVLEA